MRVMDEARVTVCSEETDLLWEVVTEPKDVCETSLTTS